MRPYPNHKKVRVAGCIEPIDEGMVELLEALWGALLCTEESCQDWGPVDACPAGWAYIKFATAYDCALFCNTLQSHIVWSLPPDEGEPMYVSFPADDIPRLVELWTE